MSACFLFWLLYIIQQILYKITCQHWQLVRQSKIHSMQKQFQLLKVCREINNKMCYDWTIICQCFITKQLFASVLSLNNCLPVFYRWKVIYQCFIIGEFCQRFISEQLFASVYHWTVTCHFFNKPELTLIWKKNISTFFFFWIRLVYYFRNNKITFVWYYGKIWGPRASKIKSGKPQTY